MNTLRSEQQKLMTTASLCYLDHEGQEHHAVIHTTQGPDNWLANIDRIKPAMESFFTKAEWEILSMQIVVQRTETIQAMDRPQERPRLRLAFSRD